MSSKVTSRQRLALGTAAILGVVFHLARAQAAPIALVTGTPIEYEEIQVPDDAVQKHLKGAGKVSQTASPSPDQIAAARRELEITRLATRIREVVCDQTSAVMIGEPAQAEIVAWLKEQGATEVGVLPSQDNENLRKLVTAYADVLEGQKDPSSVYDELLTNLMSREEWRMRVEHDVTPEKLRTMRSLVSAEPSSGKQVREAAAREAVMLKKMNEAIVSELRRADPDVAKYLNLSMTEPNNEWLRSVGPMFLDQKRSNWWKRKYEAAEVEIRDPRFESVRQRIVQ